MTGIIDLASRQQEKKGAIDFWRQHTIDAILWPSAWKKADVGFPLDWKSTEFSRNNINLIPDTPGVYAFSISIRNSIFPSQRTIVYFGKTTSLQTRYRDYIGERRRGSKRIKFGNLFKLWPDDIVFTFSMVDDQNYNLDEVEKVLNDAVIPHFVKQDFSAEIRSLVQILRG
ncbi:MAG: hypothetical protein F4195_05610 [Gammaproteobacteria bacterium]|nr:hypothetical protein [Gammaproteobacteria bacterium]